MKMLLSLDDYDRSVTNIIHCVLNATQRRRKEMRWKVEKECGERKKIKMVRGFIKKMLRGIKRERECEIESASMWKEKPDCGNKSRWALKMRWVETKSSNRIKGFLFFFPSSSTSSSFVFFSFCGSQCANAPAHTVHGKRATKCSSRFR